MKLSKEEIQKEALSRALNPMGSAANFVPIIRGFMAKGIPADDIKPRENVFTYNAWRALGRFVRKGEHGIRVTTFRKDEVEVKKDGVVKTEVKSRPWFATVFHVSQTDPISKPESEVA